LHTDINEFKKDEKGDLLADTHNVLFEWVEELFLSATEYTSGQWR
jgi:hypothetical protein